MPDRVPSPKALVFWAIYRLIVMRLPYWVPGSRRFRPWIVHGYAPGVSPRANVNRYATIGFGATVMERAGVGEHSILPSEVTVERHVTMGPWCVFITGDHPVPPDGGMFRDLEPTKKPIIVGEDCFLGYGVTVLPGVTIGRGSAIGARSVVVKDVPEGATAVGNPAKVIRVRRVSPSNESRQRSDGE